MRSIRLSVRQVPMSLARELSFRAVRSSTTQFCVRLKWRWALRLSARISQDLWVHTVRRCTQRKSQREKLTASLPTVTLLRILFTKSRLLTADSATTTAVLQSIHSAVEESLLQATGANARLQSVRRQTTLICMHINYSSSIPTSLLKA